MDLEINFKEMKLRKDGRTVIVNSDCGGRECFAEMSILQLAKIWNVDKDVFEKADNDFGSEELEDECEEVIKIIEKFPNIKIPNNKIKMGWTGFISPKNMKESYKKGFIYYAGEDLVGWGNEGIIIGIPLEISKRYDIENFQMIAYPNKVLIIKEFTAMVTEKEENKISTNKNFLEKNPVMIKGFSGQIYRHRYKINKIEEKSGKVVYTLDMNPPIINIGDKIKFIFEKDQ